MKEYNIKYREENKEKIKDQMRECSKEHYKKTKSK
jgi:hypothetical protein